MAGAIGGPKRALSAPGLQVSGSQSSAGKRDNSRSRRQQAMSLTSGKSPLCYNYAWGILTKVYQKENSR